MDTRGFILSRRPVLTPALVDELLSEAHTEEGWSSILLERGVMDPHRLQKEILDSTLIQKLENSVSQIIGSANAEWRPTRWYFLKSLPGGSHQAVHRDYLHSEISEMQLEELPGGCIIALDKEAKLSTYGWNRLWALQNEEKIVAIPPGNACVFRGDLIHRGMAYDCVNIRIHCYLDLEGQDPVVNATQIVQLKAYRCYHCNTEFPTYREKKTHQKDCTSFLCPTCIGHDGNSRRFDCFETLKTHRRRHKTPK